MKKLLITIITGCFVFVQTGVYAQNDCEATFRRALDKVKSTRRSSEKDGFEMSCLVIITGKNGDVKKETMEVVSRGDKYKYSSGQFSLYQDASTMVVIQHDQKAVFITTPMPEKMRTNQFAEMTKLQDSLQRYMTFSKCEKEFGTIAPGEGFIKIVYVPGKKIEGAGLKSITYWISATTEEIKKIAIDYTGDSAYGIKKYELIVRKLKTDFSETPFEGKALAMAMKNSKVRDEYKGYQVVDKRKVSK